MNDQSPSKRNIPTLFVHWVTNETDDITFLVKTLQVIFAMGFFQQCPLCISSHFAIACRNENRWNHRVNGKESEIHFHNGIWNFFFRLFTKVNILASNSILKPHEEQNVYSVLVGTSKVLV